MLAPSHPLARFVAEACVLDPGARVTEGGLRAKLERWCKLEGEVVPGKRDTTAGLAALGVGSDRCGGVRVRFYLGLYLGEDPLGAAQVRKGARVAARYAAEDAAP